MGTKPIKQTIEVDILGKIDQFESAIKTAKSSLSTLSIDKVDNQSLTRLYDNIVKNLDKLRGLTANNQIQIIDTKQVEKTFHDIELQYKTFTEKLGNTKADGLLDDLKNLQALIKAQSDYNQRLEATLKTQKDLTKERDKAAAKLRGRARPTPTMSTQDYLDLGDKLKIAKQTKSKAQRDLATEEGVIQDWFQRAQPIKSKDDPGFASSTWGAHYLAVAEAARKASEEVNKLQAQFDNETAIRKEAQEFDDLSQNSQKAENALKSYNQQTVGPEKTKALKALKATLLSLPDVDWSKYNIDINAIHSMDDFKNIIKQLSETTIPDLGSEAIKNVADEAANAEQPLEKVGDEIEGAADAATKLTEAASQADKISNFVKQFVGWAGAANLARNAIRQAYETVKELDAQMTEMAVVTDYTTGDYWEQLPDYTSRANELGVAIKDVYSAATLYYQQGLKTEQVTAVTTNTLKMARIAGLDAAEATNRMTSALRGFNMEINESNAQRVADVYSELAAITAADTEEISRAMGKTASLASSAGMEFETTAAFLAQIVETTRESAETAGTALTEKFSA